MVAPKQPEEKKSTRSIDKKKHYILHMQINMAKESKIFCQVM